jgi:hypothetical protein
MPLQNQSDNLISRYSLSIFQKTTCTENKCFGDKLLQSAPQENESDPAEVTKTDLVQKASFHQSSIVGD